MVAARRAERSGTNGPCAVGADGDHGVLSPGGHLHPSRQASAARPAQHPVEGTSQGGRVHGGGGQARRDLDGHRRPFAHAGAGRLGDQGRQGAGRAGSRRREASGGGEEQVAQQEAQALRLPERRGEKSGQVGVGGGELGAGQRLQRPQDGGERGAQVVVDGADHFGLESGGVFGAAGPILGGGEAQGHRRHRRGGMGQRGGQAAVGRAEFAGGGAGQHQGPGGEAGVDEREAEDGVRAPVRAGRCPGSGQTAATRSRPSPSPASSHPLARPHGGGAAMDQSEEDGVRVGAGVEGGGDGVAGHGRRA